MFILCSRQNISDINISVNLNDVSQITAVLQVDSVQDKTNE